jgi:multiple sugar transport system permease protein
MATPFVVLFAAFFIIPFVYAIAQSLESPSGVGADSLKNYKTVLSEGGFWQSIGRVAYIGVIQITVIIVFALVLALLLDSPFCRGKRVFTLIFFLPYAIPGVVASIMWGFLLSPSVDNLVQSTKLDPLGPNLVLYSIILIVVWEFVGYNMVIYRTALTSISFEVIEAARMDGCSELQLARHIKLPLLRRMIIFTSILSIIGTLQLFNEPEILSEITTISPTYTPNLSIYNEAFAFTNIPFAATESIILLIIIVGATFAFFTVARQRPGRRSMGPAGRPGAPRTATRSGLGFPPSLGRSGKGRPALSGRRSRTEALVGSPGPATGDLGS